MSRELAYGLAIAGMGIVFGIFLGSITLSEHYVHKADLAKANLGYYHPNTGEFTLIKVDTKPTLKD